jgi:competence protein ComGC
MRGRIKQSRAFTFFSILLALVIIMILTGYYFTKDKSNPNDVALYDMSMERSKRAACAADRNVLEGYIQTWMISHPGEDVSLEKLRDAAYSVPRCPQGGTYTIESDNSVSCSIHDKK